MKITSEEVKRVATLARLQLSQKEEELLTEQLDKILEYMAKLDRLEADKVEPLAHAVDIVNAFREDKITNQPNTKDLLANTPAREKNFFKVPKIIE